jgi:hypothetical protein
VAAASGSGAAPAFYGDRRQLTGSSDGDPGVIPSFGSFKALAGEAALSRIFAGQYTMIDLVAGRQLGRHGGDFVLGHFGPGGEGPGGGRSGHRLEPSGARGRLSGR